jgi:AcrR family transcriptional regulator
MAKAKGRAKAKIKPAAPPEKRAPARGGSTARSTDSGSTRARVLSAAFELFRKQGFAGTSTLEIATRAQVSKRELYALFESKQAMLAACIAERAGRMRRPVDLAAPIPQTRDAVAASLIELGASILRGACHPDVLAVYRLAIAEVDRAPEIARTLNVNGRQANRQALAAWLARAQAQGLIGDGDPAAMTERFVATLWGDLLVLLLLRVREPPTAGEIEARARAAAEALLASDARQSSAP